jgi:CTD kinase subunit beta
MLINQEVSLSCLYVSSKLHDTLKKPRDIILQSYPLRYPNLVKKGTIDPTALDTRMLEEERLRVLTVERLVLETICFKFGIDSALGIVIKIAKALEREFCISCWYAQS